ncbi:MAG: sugar nucleotide-binding protein [Planctomycetota bacterium]
MSPADERTVLILGASGFLGAHLVPAAAAAFGTVVAVSRRPELRPWRERDAAGVCERAVDLAADGAVSALLAEHRPRAVVLAAALARVGDCERDPELAQRLNAALPAEAAAGCARGGARLIFTSTDLVFGGRPPRASGYREDDEPAPAHAYGRTKAGGERGVLAAGGEALVARLPLLVGDSGGRGLGAGDQILAAVAAGQRPRLFTDETRTPLDARAAAEALVELAGRSERGLLHVAGPERLDRHALGLRVLRRSGLSEVEARARVEPVLQADLGLQDRPADVSLDAGRARALLATPLPAPGA